VIEALGDHLLHASAGVIEHPGPSDREVGGRRHQHETVRELPGKQCLNQGPPSRVGLRANVRAVDGEQVEHDVRGRHLDGQLLSSRGARVQAPLQRGEVHSAFGPEHELPIEDDLDIEALEGADDLREVPGQLALLTRLQRDTVLAAMGDATAPESLMNRLRLIGTFPATARSALVTCSSIPRSVRRARSCLYW
jgi:hypothetical protein